MIKLLSDEKARSAFLELFKANEVKKQAQEKKKQEKANDKFDTSVKTLLEPAPTAEAAKVTDEVRISCGEQIYV